MSARGEAIHRPLCPDGRAVRETPCEAPCAERSRPFVLAATILASAMAFIDGSIVTIALPSIQQDLDTSFTALQWVVNAYALLLGGLILIGGSAGDRFGRRRVFTLGLVVFAAASLACALAPTIEMLIVARALKGVGAALLVPQSLAIIAAAFPQDIRGRAIGIWAGASSITTALGPPLGGILIDFFDWRAVFWINIPLSAIALWLTIAHVPESRDENTSGSLDWLGGTLAIVAFGLLTISLTLLAGEASGWLWPAVLLLAGIGGLALFLRTEAQAAQPLMPLSLFRNRVFSGANVMTLFLYGAFTAVLFLLPFDLIERRGLSATEVGLMMLPLGIIIGTLSRFAGDWADRVGPRLPLALGSAIVTLATGMLAFGVENLWVGVLLPVVLMSLGMAAVVAPLTTAVMNAAPDAQSGAASGVNNAASRLAGLFAIAIVGAIASVVFASVLADAVPDVIADAGAAVAEPRFGLLPDVADASRALFENAFVRAYGVSMGVAAAWSLLATILALTLLPGGRPQPAAAGDR